MNAVGEPTLLFIAELDATDEVDEAPPTEGMLVVGTIDPTEGLDPLGS